jgi:hypothetical protein
MQELQSATKQMHHGMSSGVVLQSMQEEATTTRSTIKFYHCQLVEKGANTAVKLWLVDYCT